MLSPETQYRVKRLATFALLRSRRPTPAPNSSSRQPLRNSCSCSASDSAAGSGWSEDNCTSRFLPR